MPPNDFHSDDAWQRSVRDTVLVPLFYERPQAGRYVLLDKGRFATFIQRRTAADTIVQSRDGGVVAIEEKIVRWKGRAYTAFCLETESCTVEGHESPGWMRYGEADYLLYCFQQLDRSLSCYLIEFQPLKAWFWTCEDAFPAFQMNERNRTKGRVVPIDAVCAAVPVVSFSLAPESEPV